MIYICAKCKFLFERTNEPALCPSCENQCVLSANKKEQAEYLRLHGNQRNSDNRLDASNNEPQ
jgi:DNA-directed RNA polymerase subunit RPC12/RpoP